MKFVKVFWFFRLVIYSLMNRNISPYGYIGRPTYLHNFSRLKIHRKVRVLPHSRFECHGDASSIEILENTSIGQNFHCTSNGHLVIGSGTVISGNVCITNIDHDYATFGVPILEQPNLHTPTLIGNNCFIGFGVVVQAGTILGDNCVVGANSVVKGTFKEGSVLVGSPAKCVKMYNSRNGCWERCDV